MRLINVKHALKCISKYFLSLEDSDQTCSVWSISFFYFFLFYLFCLLCLLFCCRTAGIWSDLLSLKALCYRTKDSRGDKDVENMVFAVMVTAERKWWSGRSCGVCVYVSVHACVCVWGRESLKIARSPVADIFMCKEQYSVRGRLFY